MILFKPYKISNTQIDLLWNVSDEKYYSRLIKVLRVFEMNNKQLVCYCSYDDKSITISICDKGIKVDRIKNKPFIYTIVKKEIEVFIESYIALKELLQISNIYDVTITLTSPKVANSKTKLIINDNNHDYIILDKNENIKKIKSQFKQIMKE